MEVITKVNQFDSSLRRQQDVVAFDVTMDYPVVVQMLETLQVGRQGGGWGGDGGGDKVHSVSHTATLLCICH